MILCMAEPLEPGRDGSRAVGSLLLDEQLCFALYAASRAVTQLYRPLLDALGLTFPQYLVMLVLWERDRTTIGELAAALELDHGTLSPLLKRLEAHGLLERRRRTDDERVVDVVLTAAGRELEQQAAVVPQVIVDSYGVDAAEFEALRARLRELTRSVSAASQSLAPEQDS
jgi:MarR family transcriptional regulator, organic hydroperoxide resistance regulator